MQALIARGRLAGGLLAGLLLLAACGEAPPPAPPEPRHAAVGIHDVAFVVPEGWAHFDHGSEQRFQKGIAQITLKDLGPATPAAYRREIERAQRLFRSGQAEDARALLRRIDLKHAFDDVRKWRAFHKSWRVIEDGGLRGKHDSIDVENAYIAVFRVVDAFEAKDIDALVEAHWTRVDTAVHRSLCRAADVEIESCEARRVATWDTLTHDHRKEFVFVLTQGNLLVLGMGLGPPAELQTAFETLAASLEIRD